MTVLVVHNARIVTCPPWSRSPDSQHLQLRHYDWMVSSGDEIHSVGHGAEVNLLGLDFTKHKVVFIDAESRIVIPGLWDSHCHIYREGQKAVSCRLRDSTPLQWA